MPTYKAIATTTVGAGGASSITFSSIPQTYTDLVVLFSSRNDRGGGTINNAYFMSLNGSTGNFSTKEIWGSGSAASSVSNPFGYTNMVGFNPGSGATASTFGNTFIYIPNYTSSNYKSISVDDVMENNATTSYQVLNALLWSNTAAITSIGFSCDTANFVQYTSATLYGIKNS